MNRRSACRRKKGRSRLVRLCYVEIAVSTTLAVALRYYGLPQVWAEAAVGVGYWCLVVVSFWP